jgi:hypothetical protein
MNRADARARLHRDDDFDRHRHVDDDAITFADAERLEPFASLHTRACSSLVVIAVTCRRPPRR